MNEVDVDNQIAMPRKTTKLKKKKKMNMSVGGVKSSESAFQSQKKRVMKDTPRPAPKKMKFESAAPAVEPMADLDEEFDEPPPLPEPDDFDDDIVVPEPLQTKTEVKKEPEIDQIEPAVAKMSVASQEIKEEFPDDEMMDMTTIPQSQVCLYHFIAFFRFKKFWRQKKSFKIVKNCYRKKRRSMILAMIQKI